ncbi:MAG: hypothetical protein GY898_13990 [Proteobacteria bacterium]|nr:hypothetical protein [Pseudomonadota bacterium]
MSDEKTNLASFKPTPSRDREPPRKGAKVREVLFSPDEVDSIWNQAIAEAGDRNNDDFRKAFEGALRTRAMRKMFLFGSKGLELKLATGKNWAQEAWVAQEAADGSLVLSLKD